jgi:serine/threonine-protein kinase
LIGNTLGGKYRIERLLGSGGMGAVYAAEDETNGQRVAIKVIHGNLPGDAAQILQRFEREARAAGSIDTEHICRCLEAGTDAETGYPFMVLEYLRGEDLQHLLRRLGPLLPDLALRIVAQACLGLTAAHAASVVHRDIKPANIFLAQTEGGLHTVKVLDFGVAKIHRDPSDVHGETAGLTRTGSMLGSPLYMSPEQARSVKNVDHRSDLWSMGIVLYQALAGRTPYHHISGLGDLILALCSDLPPPVQQFAPWVTPEVAAAVDRALRIDPRERYQTAAEMEAALRALLPDGTEIRDDMMVALDDATHDHIAPTFFRNLAGGAQRATTRDEVAQTQHADGAPGPSAPPPAAALSTTSSPVSAPAGARSVTATTGPGLGATQNSMPGAGGRPASVVAIAVACVIAGGAGVYALTRPSPAPAATAVTGPAVTPPPADPRPPTTATTAPAASAVPTVTTSATAAESAAPAPSDSASARPAPSAPKPVVGKKAAPVDHRAYGDRK